MIQSYKEQIKMPRCRGIVGAHAGFQRWECAGFAVEDGGLSLKDVFIRNKAITNTWFGEDILWTFGIKLEFFAKLAHLDAQIFSVIGILWSPHMCKDALMGKHTSMIGCKIGKQFVFPSS